MLDTVGLLNRNREPVKRFSLGMKQRLGIAAALLPDAELLVLDEPTNGLDPAGIFEMRQLMRSLGDEGRTVIVSSHLLSEIEAACDSLAIIRHGRLLFSGPLADLVSQAGESIEIAPEHPADVAGLAEALQAKGWKAAAVQDEVHVSAPVSRSADVNRAAAEAGIVLRALRPREASLEEVFLRMTGTESGDNGRPATQNGRGGVMWREFRCEWTRLKSRNYILGGIGLMAALGLIVTFIAFFTATGGSAMAPPGGPTVSVATLEASDGMFAGLRLAANMWGIVALVVWAIFASSDYSNGLIRLLVQAQPNRLRLLGGKVTALVLFTCIATLVTTVVVLIASPAVAGATGSLPRHGAPVSLTPSSTGIST